MSLICHLFVSACRILLLAVIVASMEGNAQCRSDQRRVTVADSITMTEIAPPEPESGAHPDAVGSFSPDGRHFATVVRKGDLGGNTNVYTLLLFSTRAVFATHKPEASVTMASNSNYPAIADLHWLRNGQNLLFLGEEPGTAAQVYSFDLVTRRLKRLTSHATSVVAFDASDDGRVIVFEAEPRPKDLLVAPPTRRHGFVVHGEELSTILFSGYRNSQSMAFSGRDLFVLTNGVARSVHGENAIWPFLTLSVAPDGRHALVGGLVRNIPEQWMLYKNTLLHEVIAARKQPQSVSQTETYLLLDTKTRKLTSLVEAPKDWPNDGYLWLDGGRSLVVSHTYLPLTGVTADEQGVREIHPFVIEVSLSSQKVINVGSEDLTAVNWNPSKGEITLTGRGNTASVRKIYRRRGEAWEETPSQPEERDRVPELSVVQDMNTPPTVWLTAPSSSRKTRLLELNPQFAGLCFGQEKGITWKATDGHEVHGGLYLPPDYVRGRRYPLVIQTHAFDPHQFWIDGPWNSAFAAQPLAAKGIVVLQLGYDHVGGHTPAEAPRAMSAIDGAVDFLVGEGMIDPERLGIIGFSRTVYHVAYTLTHSHHHFAAATLADGFDGDYFQTIAFPATGGSDAAAVNGGPPYGTALTKWLDHSPLFNVGSVTAPIRLESYGMVSVIGMWGWYSLLTQRGSPVDMIVLPQAPHLLVKPWERLVSQEGNVDWFSFWLTGEEDAARGKTEQYRRWERLRRSLSAGAEPPAGGA